MPNSLQPHGLQHARLLCLPRSSGVCSHSCPLSWWCNLTISSSAAPFFCLHTFPASGSFPMGRLFASGATVLELQQQSFQWIIRLISFRIDWFDLLAVQGTLKSSPASQFRHQYFDAQLSLWYLTTGKTITLTLWTFVGKGIFLLFNMLFRFVIAFLPRNKHLTSWL